MQTIQVRVPIQFHEQRNYCSNSIGDLLLAYVNYISMLNITINVIYQFIMQKLNPVYLLSKFHFN